MKMKKAGQRVPASRLCGRGGIRTLDTARRYSGFRDRPIQPLSHPSEIIELNVNSELTSLSPSTILRELLVQPFAADTAFQEPFSPMSFSFGSVHLYVDEDPRPSSPCKSTLPCVIDNVGK